MREREKERERERVIRKRKKNRSRRERVTELRKLGKFRRDDRLQRETMNYDVGKGHIPKPKIEYKPAQCQGNIVV